MFVLLQMVVHYFCKRHVTHWRSFVALLSLRTDQITTIPRIGDGYHPGPIAYFSNRMNGRKCCPIAAPLIFEPPTIGLCMPPFDPASILAKRVGIMKNPHGKVEESRRAKSVASPDLFLAKRMPSDII